GFIRRTRCWQGDARLAGKPFNRLRKFQAFGFDQPFKGVAPGATAEAVVAPSFIVHFERRGLLFVKWAKTPENTPLALQFDTPPDELHEVRAPGDFLKEIFAKPHFMS